MTRIWLDDLRNPKDYDYPDAIWFVSYSEWFSNLDFESKNFNLVEVVHLDHDLGDVKTGYDALEDIEAMLYNGNWESLKEIYIHTSNPSAGNKMMLAKESMARYGVQMIRKHY